MRLPRRAPSGAYYSNWFSVEFDERILLPGGVAREHVPLLMHEYWHYLQNTTTVAGFYSYALAQQLIAAFSNCGLDPASGDGGGSERLSEEYRLSTEAFLQLHRAHEGDERPADFSDTEPFTVTEVRIESAPFDVPSWNKTVPMPFVVVSVRSVSGVCGDLILGTVGVEESLAYMVECAISVGLGLGVPQIGEWPYRIVERVFEHLVGQSFEAHRHEALVLGSAALLVPHPGEAVVELFRSYRAALDAGTPSDDAVLAVLEPHRARFLEACRTILDEDLPAYREVQVGRGLMEIASGHVLGRFEKAFARRRSALLYELDGIVPMVSMDKVLALLFENPPASVRQPVLAPAEQVNGVSHDLSMIGEQTYDQQMLAQAMQVLVAQHSYAWEHADFETFSFAASASLPPIECPFRGVCVKERGDARCRTRPWRHVQDRETCWYGLAVGSTLGRVKHQHLSDDQPRDGGAVGD